MALTVLLCTDGSELAQEALREGLAVLGTADRVVLATVIDEPDLSLVVGSGHAGGVMSPDEADALHAEHQAAAQRTLDAARAQLGLDGAETVVLTGAPGPSLCDYAASLPASVIVLGTRGRGGLRRAVLGSVSDHVVRNALCPVVTRTAS
jgi:nucleotide-binding universal stress UspA family protein